MCSYEQRLLSSKSDAPPLTLRECEEMMATLKNKYPEEYIIYSLSSVAVAMVFPLVKDYLQVGGACYKLCLVCFSLHCVGLGCVGVTSLPGGGV